MFLSWFEYFQHNQKPAYQNQTLRNKTFTYITQKKGPDGKFIEGKFTVLDHGNYAQESLDGSHSNDIAIGRDYECLAEKEKLGFVYVMDSERFQDVKDLELMSASFPIPPNPIPEISEHVAIGRGQRDGWNPVHIEVRTYGVALIA